MNQSNKKSTKKTKSKKRSCCNNKNSNSSNSSNKESSSSNNSNTQSNSNQNTSSKAIAAMSDDNQETINEYKDKLCIIKTPKKGGIGLNESLEGMCVLAKALYQEKEIEEFKEKFCF